MASTDSGQNIRDGLVPLKALYEYRMVFRESCEGFSCSFNCLKLQRLAILVRFLYSGQCDLATYGEVASPRLAADEAVGEMTGSGWGTILPKAYRIVLSFDFVGGDKWGRKMYRIKQGWQSKEVKIWMSVVWKVRLDVRLTQPPPNAWLPIRVHYSVHLELTKYGFSTSH